MSDGADPMPMSAVGLAQLGWFRRAGRVPYIPPGHTICRVAVEHRGAYGLVDDEGETRGALQAAMRHGARSPLDYPTVGDWVIRSLEPRHNRRVVITELLERTSLLCRRAAGPRARPQLVAANADVLAVVTTPVETEEDGTRDSGGIGHRIEWYLAAAFSGCARPMIIVNKIDTVSDTQRDSTIDALRGRLRAAAADVPILATSALDGRGVTELGELTAGGATVALSGPSGVGKSSLANRLAGAEVMPVGTLSPDGRGRHTTVRRQLIPIGGSDGGTLVDTPGLQDLIPWGGDLGLRPTLNAGAGLDLTFGDIAELSQHCRFVDCAHTVEPDCAVATAVEAGQLPAERLSAYLELVADMTVPDPLGDGSGSR